MSDNLKTPRLTSAAQEKTRRFFQERKTLFEVSSFNRGLSAKNRVKSVASLEADVLLILKFAYKEEMMDPIYDQYERL
jgi:hypothetical protein